MQKVISFLDKELNLNDETVVIGVSGGPDSMALLSLVNSIKKAKHIKIVCAHVNHNIRKVSGEEEKMVEGYCQDNDIVFETMKIDKYGDDNFHNEARNIRYDFFDKIVQKYDSKYLFTAHHADDLIETILMRIVRGSTIKGYSGFSKEVKREGYIIYRPLFEVTKEEIMNYLKGNKIPYATDLSNENSKYTRNRYRKDVLPFFKKEDANVHEKFIKFSRVLEEYDSFVDRETFRVIESLGSLNEISIYKFNRLDHLIKERVIHYILEEIYHDDLILIGDIHAKNIIDLALSSKANAYIMLPNELKVSKEYGKLIIGKLPEEVISYEIEMIDEAFLPNGKSIKKVEEEDSNSNDVCRLDSKTITMPISVRTRRHGDKIALKNSGHRRIKDIFIDSKIPFDQRDKWPIVVDASGQIIWIPGIKKSKKVKQKNETYDIILKYE